MHLVIFLEGEKEIVVISFVDALGSLARVRLCGQVVHYLRHCGRGDEEKGNKHGLQTFP